ncbi:multidrug effflux MFS transporter [Streptomyces sp. 147326]|uniref:multidrug effflux MFS transporter n=1 Tax=Streptomyces sp. 147326 TaxID=3074379 RepID=UPI0038572BD7
MILILAALTALTPLATDMLLPALPAMEGDVRASTSSIQASLTAYLAGMLVGQLLLGPISDSTGRKRLLVWGSVLFAVFSLACALAPNAQVLNAARVAEGLTGAAGMVLARAVVGDWYRGQEAAKRFTALSMIFAVAPIVAPVIGGGILALSTWRAMFVVLAVFGLLLAVAVTAVIPESLPPARRSSGGVGAAFTGMKGLLGQRPFLGYVLTFSFANVALFAYISGSSFVFQDVYDLSETQFSLTFALTAVGVLIGGAMFGALSGKGVRFNTVLTAGILVGAVVSAAHLAVAVTVGNSLVSSLVFMFLSMFGIGATIPSVMTIGQEIGRAAGGAASALLGAGQCLLGGVTAPLVGALGTDSDKPMAVLMVVGFVLAALSLLLVARPWEGNGEVTGSAVDPAAAAAGPDPA